MGALYQLDQKTVWWSALGFVVAGCLIFVAGMVVGLSLGGPSLLAEGGASAMDLPASPVAPPTAAPEVAVALPTVSPAKAPPVEASAQEVPIIKVPARDEPEPVLPPQEPEPEAVLAEDPVLSPFSLQVGAYLMQENLDQALADLEKKGLEARVVEITDSRGKILSSVRVGEYGDRSEAESAADQLRRKKGLEVLVKRDLVKGELQRG